MEDNLTQLWTYAHTIAGMASAGFAFLFVRIWDMNNKMKHNTDIDEGLKNLTRMVKKMEDALIGTYENPDGLVQKHKQLSDRVNALETKTTNG